MNPRTFPSRPALKGSLPKAAAFSLVEVTFALGIAAFCLLTVFALIPVALKTQQASIQQTTANTIASQIVADLSAALRLPPGQQSKLAKAIFDRSDDQVGKMSVADGLLVIRV